MIKAIRLALAVCTAAIVAVQTQSSSASFNVVWSFAGTPGNQSSQPATTVNPGTSISASAITRVGVGASPFPNGFGSNGWDTNFTERYLQFSVTLTEPNSTFNFETLSFVSQSSSNGPGRLELTWSDGVAPFQSLAPVVQSGITNTSVSLTATELAPLTGLDGTITFRIRNTGPESASFVAMDPVSEALSSSGTFSLLNNLTITGQIQSTPTAIPEPTSLLMVIGASIAGGVAVRRRKKNSAKVAITD